jgi:hypothetical protein
LQWTKNPGRPESPFSGSHPTLPRRIGGRIGGLSVCAIVLLPVPFLMIAQQGPQPPQSQQNAAQQTNGSTTSSDPVPGRATNTSPLAVPAAQGGAQAFDAINADRKRQITEESAALLKLATELKTDVDKTTKDTLSLTVIRKADEIEKLAHSVKEKMKLTAGTN